MTTCKYRSVDKEGRIICRKLGAKENEVSLALCRECPWKRIECDHLRFSLYKTVPAPIVVRYATGRTEVWNNEPPALHFRRAACALKVSPIHSPQQCAACTLRTCGNAGETERVAAGRVVTFPQPAAAAVG